jgi:hypothetical protein
MFGRLVRRALVTELTISKPNRQLRPDEGDITDDRRCAGNIPGSRRDAGVGLGLRRRQSRSVPLLTRLTRILRRCFDARIAIAVC